MLSEPSTVLDDVSPQYRATVTRLLACAYADHPNAPLTRSHANPVKQSLLLPLSDPSLSPASPAPTNDRTTESGTPATQAEKEALITATRNYLRQEITMRDLADSRSPAQKERAARWFSTHASIRLNRMERQVLLQRVCDLIERREVPLVIATRLLRLRWSVLTDDVSVTQHYRFIQQSLTAWMTEEVQRDTLSPKEARAVLNNAAVALKGTASTSLIGSLAMTALRDLHETEHAGTLIALLWSVHGAGVHAPEAFWRQVFDRLVELNQTLRDRMSGVMSAPAGRARAGKGDLDDAQDDDALGEEEALTDCAATDPTNEAQKQQQHYRDQSARAQGGPRVLPEVGHVFSGLTTRQIYRLLQVLRLAKWSGEAGQMSDLADQALKNIVFETEAANFPVVAVGSGGEHLSKSELLRRVRRVADLEPGELLALLQIAGDLSIPFGVSARRVSESLLAPMVVYLDRMNLIALMQVVRQTQSHSPSLITALAARIVHRGPTASYALPLSKALLRTVLREADLFAQVDLTAFLEQFFELCAAFQNQVRAVELIALADVLHALSRRCSPNSVTGKKVREMMDRFCLQINRLLQLQLTLTGTATHLLEHTIVLGMRGDPVAYPHVTPLLEARNASEEREHVLFTQREALRLSRSTEMTTTTMKPGGPSLQALGPRWEDQRESELPTLPRAALHIYNELIYLFERMVVVQASLTASDVSRFDATFRKAGLFNLFLGAQLFREAHLVQPSSSRTSSTPTPPVAVPGWIEKRVSACVRKKLSDARLSTQSSDDDVLRVLGHLHCDERKVDRFVSMVQTSPLRLTSQQREVWLYVQELARRFGSAEAQRLSSQMVERALY